MTDYSPMVWRINVRTQDFKKEAVPESWWRLGGRGLIARILVDEVDAKCDPLGPQNKLIFTPGLLVGICSHPLIVFQWEGSPLSPAD